MLSVTVTVSLWKPHWNNSLARRSADLVFGPCRLLFVLIHFYTSRRLAPIWRGQPDDKALTSLIDSTMHFVTFVAVTFSFPAILFTSKISNSWFRYASPCLWNRLPCNYSFCHSYHHDIVQSLTSFSRFHLRVHHFNPHHFYRQPLLDSFTRLKTYLFQKSFPLLLVPTMNCLSQTFWTFPYNFIVCLLDK